MYPHPICNMMSNIVLYAWKIPPRKPMTRRSPRALKLKEVETDGGYSPGMERKLEFSHRAESVIKTLTNKKFIQPPIFSDTEATTGSKLIIPKWGDLFNRINQEYYSEFIPHEDSDVRVLDDQVFPNIWWSCLHLVAF
jgi:hypothetical protein